VRSEFSSIQYSGNNETIEMSTTTT